MAFAVMAIFSLAFVSCNGDNTKSTDESSNLFQNNPQKGSELDGTTWFYNKNVDDLTNVVTSLNANIVSTNRVRIDSYGNTARMVISLTYSSNFSLDSSNFSTSVMFSFTEDNNFCKFSDFQGSGILAVFDNRKVDDRWTLINMSNKRNALYMYYKNQVTPFVNELKKSKHARIQVNLEGVGKNTFDFDIAGLKWDFNE